MIRMLTFLLVLAFGALCTTSCNPPTEPTIEITPAIASIATGQSVQLTVTRRYPDGPIETVNDRVTYTTSNRSVATISDKGLVTAGDESGTITIRVFDEMSAATASATLTIAVTTIESIEITPSPSVVLHPGIVRRLTATAHYSTGATADVTNLVSWQSTDDSVATVGNLAGTFGLVTPISEGVVTISATDSASSVQGRSTVIVTGGGPGLSAIVVSPNPASIGIGATKQVQFSAQGFFSDGSSQDVSKIVTWSSSNFAAVTIDANGLATGILAADVTITASGASGTVKGSAAAKVQ